MSQTASKPRQVAVRAWQNTRSMSQKRGWMSQLNLSSPHRNLSAKKKRPYSRQVVILLRHPIDSLRRLADCSRRHADLLLHKAHFSRRRRASPRCFAPLLRHSAILLPHFARLLRQRNGSAEAQGSLLLHEAVREGVRSGSARNLAEGTSQSLGLLRHSARWLWLSALVARSHGPGKGQERRCGKSCATGITAPAAKRGETSSERLRMVRLPYVSLVGSR